MDYAEGGDLEHLVKAHKHSKKLGTHYFTEDQVFRMIYDICMGI